MTIVGHLPHWLRSRFSHSQPASSKPKTVNQRERQVLPEVTKTKAIQSTAPPPSEEVPPGERWLWRI